MVDQTSDKSYAEVDGVRMAYVEVGDGDPIVFLHGNPTSSYLWRNVIPHVADLGRCLAPDLVGMGDSQKLPDSGPDRYTFVEHRQYLDGLLDVLGVHDDVVFVAHDWGSALAFDWSRRHADAARGLCFMEAIVAPMTWKQFPEAGRRIFQGFRSPAGEEMVLDENVFVERVLPGSVLRELTAEEMAEYRRPYVEAGESRRPTLTWPRQIPIEGEPVEVHDIVADYSAWLSGSPIPKLYVSATPGAILQGDLADVPRGWPNVTEVGVAGIHYVQEDAPDEIGAALRDWLLSLE